MSLSKRLIETAGPIIPENFNIVLYTGNGGTQSITGVGFQPDFVWIKGRTFAVIHGAYDSTRGATKYITPSLSIAEGTYSTVLNAFGADGFTVGSNGGVNANGEDYVAWCWKANGGTTSSNSNGSITSTVQANTNLGFSIVSYTGTGSNATVGHGLNAAPEFVLIKNRSGNYSWCTGSSLFNDVLAYSDFNGNKWFRSGSPWNSTQPTSSVFSLGTYVAVNGSGNNMIAYCFHSVAGYSKIGTYTGTAGALTVTTGFKPDYLIVKNTSTSNYSWYILDSVRGGSGGYINRFLASESDQAETEVTNGDIDVTFTSTGFQYASTMSSTDGFNKSGDTYIYMAFKIN